MTWCDTYTANLNRTKDEMKETKERKNSNSLKKCCYAENMVNIRN